MGVIRQYFTALRFLLAMTLIVGILYPVAIYGIGQLAMKDKSAGSFVSLGGQVVGSSLLGQNFLGAEWFHPRLSAAGKLGYDALSSGATNAGPDEPSLTKSVAAQRAAVAAENGVAASSVPADAVTTSASGLDPDISPTYAYLQANRVAGARHVTVERVNALIKSQIESRLFGFLGEPRVNVLQLNIALSLLK